MSEEENKSQSLAKQFRIQTPDTINQSHQILIIEDQSDMRLIVSSHLSKLGYKSVIQFSNGLDALEFMSKNTKPISVVICNTHMPIMDGYTLLAELRENPDFQRPPFAITMDNPSKDKIMFALESGVDEVMVKPYTLNDVFPKVFNAFKKFHNPNNPEKIYELAKGLYRNEKYEEALKVYQAIAQSAGKTARPWVGMAKVAEKQGQYPKALEYLETAENNNPNFVHLYSAKGLVNVKLSKPEPAIEAFKKAIELSPLNPLRYEDAVQPLFAAKRFEEGMEILDIALKNELSFPNLYNYLSQGSFAVKDFKNAIKHIRVALQSDEENVVYLNQLGISLKESGQVDEALKIYNSVIKIDNENKAAYFNKALLQKAKGSSDEAIKTLERLLKKCPDFKPALKKIEEFKGSSGAAA